MCATQDSPQPRPLRGEKHPFPSRSSCASMRCLCRPNWVCFFFSAFPQFLASTSLEWRQNQFSLSWGLTAAPGFAHNRLTRLQQGRYGAPLVSFPYLALKIAHRAVHGLFRFSPLPVPLFPYGEKSVRTRIRPALPARIRPQLPHTASTGLVTRLTGVVSLPGPQNRTQALTGPSLVFTVFFWYALDLAGLTSHSPACNSPHPGWVGW